MDEYNILFKQKLEEEKRIEEELQLEEKLRLEEERRIAEELRRRFEEEELRRLKEQEEELQEEDSLQMKYGKRGRKEEEETKKLQRKDPRRRCSRNKGKNLQQEKLRRRYKDEEAVKLQREKRRGYKDEEVKKLQRKELRRRYEEEEGMKRQKKELRKKYDEEEAIKLQQKESRRRYEEEEAIKLQQEELRKRYEEEEAMKRRQEVLRNRYDEEEAIKLKQEEFRRRYEEEEAIKRQQEKLRRKYEEEEAFKLQQEELRRRYEEEEAFKLQQEEFRRRYEEEEAVKLQQEEFRRRLEQEEAMRRQQEEFRRRYEEEEAMKLQVELRQRYAEEEMQKMQYAEELRRRYEEEAYYNWYRMYGYGPIDPRANPQYHFNMFQSNRNSPPKKITTCVSLNRKNWNEADSTIKIGCDQRVITTVTTSTIVQKTESVENNSLKINNDDNKEDTTKINLQKIEDSNNKKPKIENIKENDEKTEEAKNNKNVTIGNNKLIKSNLVLSPHILKASTSKSENKVDNIKSVKTVKNQPKKIDRNKTEITKKQSSIKLNKSILKNCAQISDDELYNPSEGIDILPDEGIKKCAPREDCSDVSDDDFHSVYDPEQSPLHISFTDESDCEVQPCSSTSKKSIINRPVKIEDNTESDVVSSSTCNKNPDELILYDPYFGTYTTQTMVIVPVNYPAEKFTETQQSTLKKTLLAKVLASKSFTPKFINTSFREGTMCVKCANEETRNWLVKLVPKIAPWKDAVLKVVSYEEVFSRKKVEVLVSDDCVEGASAVDILKMLEKQNAGLCTEEWFVNENNRREDGLNITYDIDYDSWASLSSKNFKLFLGLGQIQFNVIES